MAKTAPLGPGFTTLERLIGTLSDLGELAADVSTAPNLKLVLRPILGRIVRDIGAEGGSVFTLKGDSRRMELLISDNAPDRGPILTLTEVTERFWAMEDAFPFGPADQPGFDANRLFMADNRTALAAFPTEFWVPLAVRGKVYGLALLGPKRDLLPYSPLELNILSVMGRQIAVALHSRAQRTEQARARTELHQFQQIGLKIHGSLRAGTIHRILVSEAVSLVNARRGILFTYDAAHDELELNEAFNFAFKEWEIGMRFPASRSWLEPVILGKTGMVLDALAEIPAEVECYSCLAVPLLVRRQGGRTGPLNDEFDPAEMPVVGVLCVFDREERRGIGAFTEDDKDSLMSMAVTAGASIENARLYEQATVDGLTRLFIRRHFDMKLADELARAGQAALPLSLLLVDIDKFKTFNDTYGHQTGDQVLRSVAQLFARNVRDDIDVAARYGGEEMAAILPETDIDEAMRVAERIRRAVESHAVPGPDGQLLAVTISIGVAVFPHHAGDPELLVAAADAALYDSKHNGRNRVTLCSRQNPGLDPGATHPSNPQPAPRS
ncbi:MAG: sensor domain-containing diguanylate cyclase [Candidatus Sericytochromatia bacterium]|nr:sensor domain-containing diguanylate cyclase [Candidatus Tanganyikabacteria bacterium]